MNGVNAGINGNQYVAQSIAEYGSKNSPTGLPCGERISGIWHDITWAEYLENVKHVALGLHALGVK